jgi:hypothetical protein
VNDSIRRVLHSDWSKDAGKRWSCWAERSDDGWRAFGPVRYAEIEGAFFGRRDDAASLNGFDFPIGVPAFWAKRAEIECFRAFLGALREERWANFFEVAEHPAQVSIERPFFPNRSRRGVRRASLLEALGADAMEQLLRACDRRTATRPAASCLFWTLGGQQVGKAALSGWREVLLPARDAGARLWPFDGGLRKLSVEGRPIIAETYPAEAYRHIGIAFGPGRSKRRQADRQANATAIFGWAAGVASVSLDPALRLAIEDGFGSRSTGEDQFDAMAGLAGMIEVVDGRRAEAPAGIDRCAVEGWILGQVD